MISLSDIVPDETDRENIRRVIKTFNSQQMKVYKTITTKNIIITNPTTKAPQIITQRVFKDLEYTFALDT